MTLFRKQSPETRAKPSTDETPFFRNDREFIAQVENLRKLKIFLIQRGVKLSDEDRAVLTSLGYLNSLRYHRDAADPTNTDWSKLDEASSRLSAYLAANDDLRSQFQIRLVPGFLIYVSIVLTAAVVLFLPIMLRPPDRFLYDFIFGLDPKFAADATRAAAAQTAWFLTGWCGWSISLGGLGAIVFLYVNALAIEVDKLVDVSDRGFVLVRIAIGCLFGLVLGIATMFSDPEASKNLTRLELTGGVQHSVLLIAPFVYGFSTPLVISIMNRFIETIQGFFGIAKK